MNSQQYTDSAGTVAAGGRHATCRSPAGTATRATGAIGPHAMARVWRGVRTDSPHSSVLVGGLVWGNGATARPRSKRKHRIRKVRTLSSKVHPPSRAVDRIDISYGFTVYTNNTGSALLKRSQADVRRRRRSRSITPQFKLSLNKKHTSAGSLSLKLR